MQSATTKARSNARAQLCNWPTGFAHSIAQYLPDFFLHAAPMTLRPAFQSGLDVFFQIADDELSHIESPGLDDIVISCAGRIADASHRKAVSHGGPFRVTTCRWLGMHVRRDYGIIVSMTRFKHKPSMKTRDRARSPKGRADHWPLQDAKARFSELVRKVRSDGPQHVTVHGREEVVVVAAEEFRRLKGGVTGKALVEVMRASPHRDIEIEPSRGSMPIRGVSL